MTNACVSNRCGPGYSDVPRPGQTGYDPDPAQAMLSLSQSIRQAYLHTDASGLSTWFWDILMLRWSRVNDSFRTYSI